MQRTLLALALILTAGVSYAQTLPSNEPRDPYGRPLIGRNDWVRQPGDQPGPTTGNPAMASSGQMNAAYSGSANLAAAPASQPMGQDNKLSHNNKLERDHAVGPEPTPMDATGSRQAAFKDEYGFRYDSQGNRLDARGNIISPHIPQR
jgi:hypothetical protein